MKNESILCALGVLSGLLVLVSPAAELVTDRPDATESSSVVDPEYVQVEMGWLLTDSGDTKSHEFAQTLIRVGVVDDVELRVGGSGYLETEDSEVPEGAGDGELGLKIYLAEERGFLPETALLAAVSVPWGAAGISSEEVDPGFRFAFSHTLSDTFSLSYNLGAEWGTEDDSTRSSFVYTTALGIGLSDSWGLYVEFFGDVGLNTSGTAHSFDAGLTYLVRKNLQFDVLAGVGLSDDTDDWFTGAGVSYRFPN